MFSIKPDFTRGFYGYTVWDLASKLNDLSDGVLISSVDYGNKIVVLFIPIDVYL